MTTLDDLRDGDRVWPPPDHADRIAIQEDYRTLWRNRRDEILQLWSADLTPWINVEEDLVPFPAAKIAARTLATFLFGEDPTYAHDDAKRQTAIEEMAAANVLGARLLEAVVSELVEGEVYPRIVWDADLLAWPIITFVPGRQVIPTFRHGILVDAVIVRTWRTATGVVWRHLESQERGKIRNELWRGTSDRMGVLEDFDGPQVPANVVAAMRGILPEIGTGAKDDLLIQHVPLGRADDSPHGVSLFDGLEAVALALTRLYSQEQHDAEMARRRIAVAQQYLYRDAAGRPSFDPRLDLLVLSEEAAGAVGATTVGSPVTPIEFHDDLVQRERIVGRFREFLLACGIAPASLLPEDVGNAPSGTSRKLAQSLTIQTSTAIGRYWQHALPRLLDVALTIAAGQLRQDVGDAGGVLPSVTLADGLVSDPVELARMLTDLDTADAISLEEKVRRQHPEWSDDEVEAEMDAIRSDRPAPPAAPPVAPFGRPPGEDEDAAAGS